MALAAGVARPEQRTPTGRTTDGEDRHIERGGRGGSGGAGLSARQVQMRSMIQAVGMLPVLVILCIGFHYLSDGRFFTPQNISIVAQQASINTVLAAGMTFVILTGGIDLSVGSILAASAMAAVIASLIPGWGLLGIPAGLVTGLFFGFLNGALIAFVRLAALHRHAGLAHRGARHRPADGRRHHGVQSRTCRSPSSATPACSASRGSRSSPWS